jgi:uncharacterized YigZ family protein
MEGYFEDKGSKFLAYTFPCYHEEDLKEALSQIKEQHPKATHHCYAYRIGTDKNNHRANDDGEPSGSAGRPILGQIDSFNLSNVLVIVVRYYGGTNLGVSGLINAYKKAAADAFNQATIVEMEVMQEIRVSCTYLELNDLFNHLKSVGVESWQEDYSENCNIRFSIPLSSAESLSLWLDERELKFHILKTE